MRQEGSLNLRPGCAAHYDHPSRPDLGQLRHSDNEQAQIQKEVQAKQLALPKDGNFEVALRRADRSLYEKKPGRLNFADVRVSPQTGTRETRADFPTPAARSSPASSCASSCAARRAPNAVTVPQRAVLEGPQGKFVYVVSEKNQAEPRPVEAGEWAGQSWIITGGLKPGGSRDRRWGDAPGARSARAQSPKRNPKQQNPQRKK